MPLCKCFFFCRRQFYAKKTTEEADVLGLKTRRSLFANSNVVECIFFGSFAGCVPIGLEAMLLAGAFDGNLEADLQCLQSERGNLLQLFSSIFGNVLSLW
jgi:hypothetical protein